jgi:hypothetical protein
MKTKNIFSAVVIGMMCIAFFACKKDSNNDTVPSGTVPANSMVVKMTDGPGDYAGLNVEISKVEVYLQNSGWVTLKSGSQFFNVLTLTNGAEAVVCSKTGLQAGVYSKLRITFGEENYLKLFARALIGGVEVNTYNTVKLGWDGPKEIEVNMQREVSVTAGASVLFDFDVAQSISAGLQGYILNPDITVVDPSNTGIQGKFENGASACIRAMSDEDSVSTYANAKGEFLIRNMKPGMYDVIISPTPHDTIHTEDRLISDVEVIKGRITQLGTIK